MQEDLGAEPNQDEYTHPDPNLMYCVTNVLGTNCEETQLLGGCNCQNGDCSSDCQCLEMSGGSGPNYNVDDGTFILDEKSGQGLLIN
jgi:hypothetical protein